MIRQLALASKTLPIYFATVIDQIIKIIHFTKGGVLNSRLFKKSCTEKEADYYYIASFPYKYSIAVERTCNKVSV